MRSFGDFPHQQMPVWSGPQLPAGAPPDQLFWHTTRGIMYTYRWLDALKKYLWLSAQLFPLTYTVGDQVQPATATRPSYFRGFPGLVPTYDMWLETWYSNCYVGTPNSGTAFWTIAITKIAYGSASETTLASYTTAAIPNDQTTSFVTPINQLLGTGFGALDLDATRTSNAGGLYMIGGNSITARLVG